MNQLEIYTAQFEGSAVHTLTVDGRPAWIAREIGALLGYSHEGKRLVNKITTDWACDFVEGQDFALLVGAELATVKSQCASVPPSTRGLLVLFESGLHLALVKTHMPLGLRLRRFLVDEVLPQIVRTGAYVPASTPSPLPDLDLETVTRALRVDFEDRRFRSRALHQTAEDLAALGRLDEELWALCLVCACEIALGQPLPMLRGATEQGWVEVGVLAQRLGQPTQRVLDAAEGLGLLQQAQYAKPHALREDAGWTLTYRLSPQAVALIEAIFAEQSDEPLPSPPHAA